eukprot:CAMPEP_0204454196 /NCGR_PEP_ID=MMETSP0470-20130426/102238_1 /ASSEMBLY_ACC=CAM_ASM_000385 /TAXON_ID=2969 /ORGANISM="Oxyrrhis marina" /LENGTH=35 /DNA_ID= /DNA_START= /DNA_END= /DNA_ORIENTATION=
MGESVTGSAVVPRLESGGRGVRLLVNGIVGGTTEK